MLDISRVPFSRFGSFLAISPCPDRKDNKLYIRSVRRGDTDKSYEKIFAIEPLDEGKNPLNYRVIMKPEELCLKTEKGSIFFCLEKGKLLRIRGEGLSLRLKMKAGIYDYTIPYGENRVMFLHSRKDLKFLITPLSGSIETGEYKNVKNQKFIYAHLLPSGPDKTFQFIIEEFLRTCQVKHYQAHYEQCVNKNQAEFSSWENSFPPTPSAYQKTRELAAFITWSSVVEAEGQLSRRAMYMSKNWMTNIWSWDNCFNALALIHNKPELAFDQLMLFFELQDKTGLIPDFANDLYACYSFTKPPIHGWALDKMMQINPAFFSEERLREIYTPLEKWTRYWLDYTSQNGFPSYFHGNDSGWDNSTIFFQKTPLQSPDLLSFLILQMNTLEKIAQKLGYQETATTWKKKATYFLKKLITHFWNGEKFILYSRGKRKENFPGDSLIMFMPLVLGNLLENRIRKKLIQGLKEENRFLTPFGLATESLKSPYFQSKGYWQGPIWAPSTLLVCDGLNQAGELNLARLIARRFCDMTASGGMAENFDPLTGEGLCDPAFTWTSSVFLFLAGNFFQKRGV